METKYNPTDIEARWYQYWLDNKLFHSEPDGREPYTIVIPPPNVTGVLHMGHVLNETIQDILVRRARLEGKNACWVPGTDHASIATEAKVIKRLKEQGINKSDLTREQFLKHAWDWTDEHGGIILKQLRKLGCSCDWDRTSFTMDETRSKAVIHVFCDLYKKGLIYRGLRMVNWDPERQTALSDEEVIYHDEHNKFYYLRYEVAEEPGKYAIVATTRPETICGLHQPQRGEEPVAQRQARHRTGCRSCHPDHRRPLRGDRFRYRLPQSDAGARRQRLHAGSEI